MNQLVFVFYIRFLFLLFFIKLRHVLKCTVLMFIEMHFDNCIHSCNHDPKQDQEHSPHPRIFRGML